MKKMLLALFILLVTNSSCKNIYEEMASKDTDEAILYAARQALGTGDWDGALAQFALLSPAKLAETEVVVDVASAYSGRCGLNFIDLAEQIMNFGGSNILDMLADNFIVTSAANIADCETAETILKTVADVNGVVSTERGQFLMAFNSLAKIGSILNYYSDTDDDGAVDAGWNACDPGTGVADLPVNDANEIATGIVLFYKNLQGSTFGAALTAPIDAVCTDPMIDGSPADFCDIIDPTLITNPQRQLIRGMVVETDDGIGLSINPGDTSANAPGCP